MDDIRKSIEECWQPYILGKSGCYGLLVLGGPSEADLAAGNYRTMSCPDRDACPAFVDHELAPF